jgi:hypothetical protein
LEEDPIILGKEYTFIDNLPVQYRELNLWAKEINKNFLNLEKTFFEEEASDREQELIID